MKNNVIDILPHRIRSVITDKLNQEKIIELRLRADKPALINYGGKWRYISPSGLVDYHDTAIYCTQENIVEIVLAAGEYSIYAFNNEIIEGYISYRNGVRIGVCGSAVNEGEKISTIKEFSSVSIRFPHEIIGSGQAVRNAMQNYGKNNVLILSPPGAGKTTMLRDLSRILASESPPKNILIVDERNEISATLAGAAQLNVGNNVDVIRGTDKKYAFENGVRSLTPQFIITDELYRLEETEYLREARGSGVNVIASAHADSIDSFKRRALGNAILSQQIFNMYVILSMRLGVGTLEQILDENLSPLPIATPDKTLSPLPTSLDKTLSPLPIATPDKTLSPLPTSSSDSHAIMQSNAHTAVQNISLSGGR